MPEAGKAGEAHGEGGGTVPAEKIPAVRAGGREGGGKGGRQKGAARKRQNRDWGLNALRVGDSYKTAGVQVMDKAAATYTEVT